MSNSRSRTFCSALAAALLFAAAPAHAQEGSGKQLKKTLTEYRQLKKREATLQTVLRRANAAQGEKYAKEYEALKPKLYDAAQKMELAVQRYEKKHGRKKLCADLGADLRPLVPACLKSEQ